VEAQQGMKLNEGDRIMYLRGRTMSTVRTAGRLFFGACLTAAFATAGAAESAGTLSQTDGLAVVSKGAEYVEAQQGMKLNEGDRIMVMEGGSAVISFADGCQYTLSDNELLTIGATSTCASAAAGSYKIDPYSAVSQDSSTAAAGYQQAGAGGAAAGGASVVVPAVVVGIGVIALASDTGSDKRNPVSP
jgi:hypothetical protein